MRKDLVLGVSTVLLFFCEASLELETLGKGIWIDRACKEIIDTRVNRVLYRISEGIPDLLSV